VKRNKKIIIIIVGIVILSNTFPFTGMLKNLVDGNQYYRYSNYNGSNTFYELWSRDFEMMERTHRSCLSKGYMKDKHIYRLFKKNPLAFWRWRLYFFDKRFKLPYRNWEDIKKIREKENVKDITGCTMDF